MRCPKCQYISFDDGDRCRNCGYEFSLTVDVSRLDLPIQTGNEAEGPMSDFSLSELDAPSAASPARSQPRPPTGRFDLPLFKDRAADDDTPLVAPSAVPRAPLAVRKSSPVIARTIPRARVEEPELDLDAPDLDDPDVEVAAEIPPALPGPAPDPAPLGRRVGAALIDLLVLGAVDIAILYLTLRLCGLQFVELGMIPLIPFAAFLAMQNGGYFVAFVAAGGQSIGKMLFGLKVVPEHGADPWGDRVPLGMAVLRAAAWMLSVLPAGLGLLPMLFSADRRALHDRISGTRVVKA